MPSAPETVVDLSRLNLQPGAGKRIELPVELAPFELGGQTYVADPAAPQMRLEASRHSSGFAFKLNFQIHIEGPCMRCLEHAEPRPRRRGPRGRRLGHRGRRAPQPLRRRGRARHRPLGPRRRDARPPHPDPLPPRLPRPLPRLRRAIERRRPGRSRTREADRRAVVGAERPEAGVAATGTVRGGGGPDPLLAQTRAGSCSARPRSCSAPSLQAAPERVRTPASKRRMHAGSAARGGQLFA